ncbi:NB-ARC domain-containing protein, partial [Reticulomyxa filosa]
AEQFNLIVSEDKDFFDKKSKTHHRFHNIKLYVPKHDVYIEMQATLKNFTTLEGYTVIENPKLSHLFYEHIRAWKPNNSSEEELKQASDETLTKINDIICEWIDARDIKKIANRYKPHSEIRILKPPQLKEITEEIVHDANNTLLKLTKFVYDQLCKFNPRETKGQAIYVVLFEFFKRYIVGETNPASCVDVACILQESRKQELEEDIAILQALETYIPLQANNYAYTDNDANETNDSYNCHQHVLDLLAEGKEEKENEQKRQQVMILQGKSGSGKSLFCRYLEETLWSLYVNGSTTSIPVYISLPKCYDELNEKQIVHQALQMKQISKEILDTIRENISFVFILDGFDEIFDKYNKSNNNERYFFNRFNLGEWNAKIIVSCRSDELKDEEIKQVLIGSNNATSMIYLWPFSKEQMNGYIDKFVKMNKINKMNDNLDWTVQQYEETLKNYPNLNKMMEEPFSLRMILTILPLLMKQRSIGTKISKAQVYEVFNEQWIDIHVKNISNKLSELRIQTNTKKIKLAFQQYCQDLAFDMFIQENQVAADMPCTHYEILSKLDPNMIIENKYMDEKLEVKTNKSVASDVKTQDIWEKYFNGDSIAKYVLRRVGDSKYQFLHKSCQEYYAAQKIIFDIISWKPNNVDVNTNINNQFQQQFETNVPKFFINYKLLNEELGIIQFIAERIHDTNPIYTNLKSRLFRIIEASKNSENISIAAANAITILNSANVNMHYKNWDHIKIPHAILDHAFLERTNLNGANLDHASFYQTCLNNVNFTNASMNKVYFGEYAYLKGHAAIVDAVQFSPDGSNIVSCSHDSTIRIWDTSSGKQLQLLEGHSGVVNTVRFSPDGSKLVSCAWDYTVRMWDVSSGQQIQKWEEHSDSVNSALFSPDGSKIVSCSRDNTIRIWDVLSGKRIHLLKGHSANVNAVQFSSDGSKIASCSNDRTIRIWDVLSGEQLRMLEGHLDYVLGIQFSSNGSKLISFSNDKSIRVWDLLLCQQIHVLEGHLARINEIQLSSGDSKVLSCSEDKTMRIWDLSSGKQVQILEGHSGSVKVARFSLDGFRIISGSSDKTIRIWDVASGKQLQILGGHLDDVRGIEFFPKDSKILSYSSDKTIRIWDIGLEKKIQLTEGHSDSVNKVQFSPDGSKIVSCSLDKTVRLWDVQTGRQIQVFEGHSSNVRKVRFLSDGSKVISYSEDKTIRVWDAFSGKQLQMLKEHPNSLDRVQVSKGHPNRFGEIQPSPDNSKILSYLYADKLIRIWCISSGQLLQVLEGHSDEVRKVQFSPDGSKIVSCSNDKTVRLWDTMSGKQLQLFEGHTDSVTSVKLSSDGHKILSCAEDETIRLWDVSSGKQLLLLEGHSNGINGVQFSPDCLKILSCSLDGTVRLWDALSGEQLQNFRGHSHVVWNAQFLPDSTTIVSYSWDKTIRIWDVFSGKQIQLLEGHTGNISGVQVSPDGSKIVSCSDDRTIRLWGTNNKVDISKNNLIKCLWQVGIQSFGLSMKESVWKDTIGLTPQQKLLVDQRGGKF